MINRTNTKVIITSGELEQGNRVGVLKSNGRNYPLYQDEDRGLMFYRNSKQTCFMDMLGEKDYNNVIDAMLEVSFTASETKQVKVNVDL